MAWALRHTMDTKAQGSDNRLLIVLLASIPIFLLSMVVTVLLATQYFIDDVAIALGLLGAVFVVLLALFLLVYRVGGKLREGQTSAAIMGGLLILGLGLLIAPLVGVLPWSMRWLWYSSPWVVKGPMELLFIGALIWKGLTAWKLRRARASAVGSA